MSELRWAYNAYLLVACVERVELCLPPMARAPTPTPTPSTVGGGRRRKSVCLSSTRRKRTVASSANDMYGAWVCVTHHDLAFPLGRQLYFGLPNKHIALRWKRGLQMAVELNLPSPLGEQRLLWLCDAFRVATREIAQ